MPIKKDEEVLKNDTPHIVVGTPGRLLALGRTGHLKLKNVKFFVLDECDKMIGDSGKYLVLKYICYNFDLKILDMRRDVQEIFKMTPQEKQVMMFSATLPKDLRVICKKFMQEVRFSSEILLNFHSFVSLIIQRRTLLKKKKKTPIKFVHSFKQCFHF